MKKRGLLHPFLFAVYPVLLLFSRNIGHVSIPDIILPLGIIVGSTALLFAILTGLLRSGEKAAILLSISLFFFFSYGYIHDILEAVISTRNSYLPAIVGLLFIVIVYLLLRRYYNPQVTTTFLNVVATTLIIISLVNIGAYWIRSGPRTEQLASELPSSSTEKEQVSRDIYYIILERYGAASTLESIYDFNNEEFVNYLTEKGFYVASESRANYLKTGHSLASSLNLEYINYLSEEVDQPDSWKPIHRKLEEYTVWRFLKERGYDFIHLGGWWEPTRTNKYADISLNFQDIPEFSDVLVRTTAIYPILYRFNIGPFGSQAQYHSVLKRFDKLSNIPEHENPTFTFAHMFITHDPFKFDEDCAYLSPEEARNSSTKENYINQLICANTKVKELIDSLLSQYPESEPRPIIIVQGDEGPFPKRYLEDGDSFNWDEMATKTELRQKMRILNAYYLPGVSDDALYPSITPVNTFRLVFNHYFDTDLELLPDKSYAFKDGGHIYEFFDVTNMVNYD
ncbi:MAG: hypothetical protein ACLFSX_03660 [Candidatus Acetothermia bacterium]